MTLIVRIRLWTLLADVGLALASYELALVVFAWYHVHTLQWYPASFDWGMPLGLVVILGTFLYIGLYKLEIWVSRPLHLATLFKGVLAALVITAFFVFAFKAPFVADSRLSIFTAFALFFLFSGTARIGLLDRLYREDVREHPGRTLVIGESADSSILVSRLKELRGYSRVSVLEPQDKRRNGFDAEPTLIEAIETLEPAPRQVFIDGASVGHKATIDLVRAACGRGAEVYVTGMLVSPLDTTRLLLRLFELPVMRVRNYHEVRRPGSEDRAKRALDLAAAAAALALLTPFFAAIAAAIKLDSHGPVFLLSATAGPGTEERHATRRHDAGRRSGHRPYGIFA